MFFSHGLLYAFIEEIWTVLLHSEQKLNCDKDNLSVAIFMTIFSAEKKNNPSDAGFS